MRTIHPTIAAKLTSEVAHLAHVWRITRRDGAVFGFTNHDHPITVGGLVCAPGLGVTPGRIEKSLGLAVDSASIGGALNADAITEEDLAAGLWDGAAVEALLVDWAQPDAPVHLYAGSIGETRRGASAFEAELRGVQAPLQNAIGRVFAAQCDAELGDARCSVVVASPTSRRMATVAAVGGPAQVTVTGLETWAEGWASHGVALHSRGWQVRILTHANVGNAALLTFATPAPIPVAVGDAITITAGCDKQASTCAGKFANILNFRGFPHMPGNDLLQSGAVEGEQHDGGSRQGPPA